MSISRQLISFRKDNNLKESIKLLKANDLDSNQLNILLSIYIDNLDTTDISLESFINRILVYDFNIYCQLINIYCKLNNYDKSIQILDLIKKKYSKFKRKMYSPFIIYFKNTLINKEYILSMITRDIIDNDIEMFDSDFLNLINILNDNKHYSLHCLLNHLSDKRHIFKGISNVNIIDSVCSNCKTIINKVDINKEHYLDILKKIKISLSKNDKSFYKFHEWCSKNNRNIIIDGGNVGYHNNTDYVKINFKNIDRLVKLFPSNNVLVFLHIRHTKNVDLSEKKIIDYWKKNNMIFFTKPKINDDYYWLYFSIYQKHNDREVNIITNDDIKDHIFKFSKQLYYIKKEIQIKYELNHNIKLFYPNSYSSVIQYNKTNFHIPMNNGWICNNFK